MPVNYSNNIISDINSAVWFGNTQNWIHVRKNVYLIFSCISLCVKWIWYAFQPMELVSPNDLPWPEVQVLSYEGSLAGWDDNVFCDATGEFLVWQIHKWGFDWYFQCILRRRRQKSRHACGSGELGKRLKYKKTV